MASDLIPSIKDMIPITAKKDSWISRWEPRTKVITCILMVFGLVFLNTPKLLIISYAILTTLVLSMGISIKEFLKRTSFFLPFIILMAIPILLGGGFPPNKERIILAQLLAFKGLNALSIMFIMFFSQPVPELLNALSYMNIPGFLITIIFLSWRYVFLLGERLNRLYKALVSRLFKPGFNRDSFKAYGQVMGGMLIKSIDTSDKVYRAMASRGFDGTMPTSKPREIKILDILKSVILISSVILLNVIEKWWL